MVLILNNIMISNKDKIPNLRNKEYPFVPFSGSLPLFGEIILFYEADLMGLNPAVYIFIYTSSSSRKIPSYAQ